MGGGRQRRRSDLFLVRLWAEEASDGETEWRGKVQRAISGEARYFHDWSQLVDLLLEMAGSQGSEGGGQKAESRK